MLSKFNGRFSIENGVFLSSELDLSEFSKLAEYGSWKHLGANAYQRTSFDNKGRRFVMRANFIDSRLNVIYLQFFLTEDVEEIDHHSNEIETKRKHLHDQILVEWLGKQPYNYFWGNVASGLSNPEAGATIEIHYTSKIKYSSELKTRFGYTLIINDERK